MQFNFEKTNGKQTYSYVLRTCVIVKYDSIIRLQSVSNADIRNIVNKHNQLRSNPQTTETAKEMCEMVRR